MVDPTTESAHHWQDRPVTITGGASFIGSNLAERLCSFGADVTIVDDLSSGTTQNVQALLDRGVARLVQGDLRDGHVATASLAGADTVFHLAADHGGRGYVDLHQAACAENLFLDGQVLRTARDQNVRKVVLASSGCVYPLHLQMDPGSTLELTEDLVGPPYNADGMYGNAKLMAELTLKAYVDEYGIQGASCRYFTVYGQRGIENHAVIAMMARALSRQDPFVIWGDGTQVRNWTHVNDIVRGTILAGERIDDGSAVNLGTQERVTVQHAAELICSLAGYRPRFVYDESKPVGPLNRVASSTRAKAILGWEPEIKFDEGAARTWDWYRGHRDPAWVGEHLDAVLSERGFQPVAAGASA